MLLKFIQNIVIKIDQGVDLNGEQSAAIDINTLSRRVHLKTLTIAACLNHNETGHINYMTIMSYFKVMLFFDYIDINIR